jgi:thiamine phosphate synthase YjbQ (UPF0047 family)
MTKPSELNLTLVPQCRFQAIDVSARVGEASDLLQRHGRALFCSFHTTAGYLGQSLSTRMHHRQDLLSQFFGAFHALFPEGGEYRHDRMELRTELSDDQKAAEPPNGDSHLTFIGAGMRNCVTYSTKPGKPVYFIDLDGMGGTGKASRQRKTVIVGFDRERAVARLCLTVPVSKDPIDSVNLADGRLGIVEAANELIRQMGLERARVDIALDAAERHVGLTVNEYETLLMQNDLTDVLKDPMRFAQYDAEASLNSLMPALRLDQASFERLVAKTKSFPARRFFRSRKVSFLAASDGKCNVPQLIRGTYQSPILVQWQSSERQSRRVDITVVELS